MSSENKKIGARGELLAKKYLERKGYQILETNFYCRFGEIDIIAKLNDEVSFVEVKTRKQERYGTPAESMNKYKKNHMYRSAELYTYLYRLYNFKISLDVIEVYLYEDKEERIEYMKNAIIENPKKTFGAVNYGKRN